MPKMLSSDGFTYTCDLIYSWIIIIRAIKPQNTGQVTVKDKLPLFWTIKGLKLSNYNNISINLKPWAAKGSNYREQSNFYNWK